MNPGKKTFLSVAMLVAGLATAPAIAQQQLSIATGGTGGIYYPLGGGLAEIINAHVPGFSASAEVTGGSVENLGLVAMGDADLATVLGDTAWQAQTGTGRFERQRLAGVRGLASLYMNLVQIVTLADSDIFRLSELRGKRVSVGAPGSGTEVNANAILAANGMSYTDIAEQRLNFNETAAALSNGDIDAGFFSVGAPTSSILNLATTNPIRIIGQSDAELAAARAANPVFTRALVPAGTYRGLDEDVAVLGVPNILLVSDELPEPLAYAITRALFEHVGDLVAVHPAARQITAGFTLDTMPIPLHPGAIRYFEETGRVVPEPLRP